jgi:hypothetical protein
MFSNDRTYKFYHIWNQYRPQDLLYIWYLECRWIQFWIVSARYNFYFTWIWDRILSIFSTTKKAHRTNNYIKKTWTSIRSATNPSNLFRCGEYLTKYTIISGSVQCNMCIAINFATIHVYVAIHERKTNDICKIGKNIFGKRVYIIAFFYSSLQ